MQIKVNGVTISVENSPVTTGNLTLDNLEKQSILLSRESEDITKMIKLYDIMSDVKAVESFGYRSTEGVGEKIANAAKAVWKRIKEFFIKIGKFIADFFANGAMITRANMLLNKVNKMDEKDIDFNISISVTKLTWLNSLRPIAYRDLGKRYSSAFDALRTVKAGLMVDDKVSHASNANDITANIEKMNAANPFTRIITENISTDNGSPQIQILKILNFNSKQSIIDFLNGVKTKSDPVTVSLNKAKADIDECIRELDKLLAVSDLRDTDANNLKKGYTFLGKANSKLCSCGTSLINMLLTGIGMALKASAKNAASTNNQ